EPQAGSDLALVRTRAEPQGDGTYRIFGTKIFITWGEHDMAENIVHLVLARLPDAPDGVKGISLFIVPKFMVDQDGSLGARNDVHCVSIEHKLGIKASPTAVLQFGDHGGAIGYLVGEVNCGLEYMFIMMNAARFAVGVQGVALADRAYQRAVAYAKERVQSRPVDGSAKAAVTIIHHPDVRRMLGTMRALTEGARALAYVTAAHSDIAHHHPDAAVRADHQAIYEYLVPVVKGWSTELAIDVTSLGVQVHGGMGYIEETGAAQHLRDARILPIYEGTNGIQAIDLAIRKLPLADGAAVAAEIADISSVADALRASNDPRWGRAPARLDEALAALKRATAYMAGAAKSAPESALAGATDYLRLFALARGAASLVHGALALGARGEDDRARVEIARFHAEHHAPAAAGLADSVIDGAEATLGASQALAS
ncbi:MAG: acyl-CoA dehydrogenase, partial [Hyphomicrobiales bacterium]|nr:acyl-CoA dehydrogenase [Hyphomicrobiales bacterium]